MSRFYLLAALVLLAGATTMVLSASRALDAEERRLAGRVRDLSAALNALDDELVARERAQAAEAAKP